ncbi:270e3d18-d16e-488d-9692-953a9004c254 [Sclerotinia trifoliorum]|uniref:270e3d18-d16e-488d-9692-953a9004c254 n=1 Tax=Sclerotinia trifoliorum TaxID=28548 RepID=A0A8H2VUA8_9HELO|nr:270e3d18-d16e-488d-9692-953a9004c254 [Sclerotinia trifoliorum]
MATNHSPLRLNNLPSHSTSTMSTPTPLPPLPLPAGITSTYIPTPNLHYHILHAGNPSHPLLLLLHGFPELAFSWRKIMPLLAAEGYHVVAYDQRGCGRTTGWDTRAFSSVDLNSTTLVRLVRDAVILVNALGYKDVKCVLGHDFGAVVASWCALIRPDLFKSVVIMSHPFKGSPALPTNTPNPNPAAPSPTEDIHESLANLPPRKHYKWYYSTPTAATEMDNPKSELLPFLRGYFYLKSGHWPTNTPQPPGALPNSKISLPTTSCHSTHPCAKLSTKP